MLELDSIPHKYEEIQWNLLIVVTLVTGIVINHLYYVSKSLVQKHCYTDALSNSLIVIRSSLTVIILGLLIHENNGGKKI